MGAPESMTYRGSEVASVWGLACPLTLMGPWRDFLTFSHSLSATTASLSRKVKNW
jgi:hypothetical protein